MATRKNEEWISIAELNDDDQIVFTEDFQNLMGECGWEAKAFVGHLIGLWYDPFEHMLDYTSGESEYSDDQPGLYDRNGLDEPQEVVEYWARSWRENDKFFHETHNSGTGLDLGVGWYRDILRAKLVSLKLPKRLITEYRDKLNQKLKMLR